MFEGLMSSSVDLPKAGTVRSGSLYELPTLARLTDESDCSSWPTATVKGNHNRKGLSPSSGDGLATAAGMWGTPTVAMTQGGNLTRSGARNNELLLKGQAKHWATPTARDWKDGACADADVPTNGLLGWQAPRWPTPSACMANDSEDPQTWLARRELLKAKAMNGNGAGMPLAIAAKLHANWPTPRASDGEKGGPNARDGSGSLHLSSAAVRCSEALTSSRPDPATTTDGEST